ncbi:MAG: hypothetical protein IPP88_12545 [Betaproteobacteria bacterium]|nr:hypothetical protein [Betaproteobacteria bacterium]
MNFAPEVFSRSLSTLRSTLFISLVSAFTVVSSHSASPSPAPGLPVQRAGTAVIDDSATVVLDGTPAMTWRSVTPKNRDNAIVGRTRVNVRLATAPWLGKSGRIYMVLPTESTGTVKIIWRSHGVLLDGQLLAGGRALMYNGPIRERRMEDVLDVQIEADGMRLSSAQQLRFHFEIDVE